MKRSDCFRVHDAIHAGDAEVLLSDGEKVKILNSKSGVREAYAHGVRFMEQNRTKTSKHAKESRAGHRLTWILTNPRWGLLKDAEVAQKCSFIIDDDEEVVKPDTAASSASNNKRKAATLIGSDKKTEKEEEGEEEDKTEEVMAKKKQKQILESRVYTLSVAFPSNWSTPLSLQQKVQLYPVDEEYEMVEKLMKSTASTPKVKLDKTYGVTRVFRLQHPDLWAHYSLKKKEIQSSNEGRLVPLPGVPTQVLDSTCNEVFLFHGLNAKVLDKIVESGFDERVSSLQGLFGGGVYFAENSSKSDAYSHTENCGQVGAVYSTSQCTCAEEKERAMLVCKVVVGSPAIKLNVLDSRNPLRRPPEREDGHPGHFDSVVGEAKHHNPSAALPFREIIIYDRRQVYPEYLVYYQRKK